MIFAMNLIKITSFALVFLGACLGPYYIARTRGVWVWLYWLIFILCVLVFIRWARDLPIRDADPTLYFGFIFVIVPGLVFGLTGTIVGLVKRWRDET